MTYENVKMSVGNLCLWPNEIYVRKVKRPQTLQEFRVAKEMQSAAIAHRESKPVYDGESALVWLRYVDNDLQRCIDKLETGKTIDWTELWLDYMLEFYSYRDLNFLNVILKCEGDEEELRRLGAQWPLQVIKARLDGGKLNTALVFDNPEVLDVLAGDDFEVDFLRAPDAEYVHHLKIGCDDLDFLRQCRDGIWADAMFLRNRAAMN